MAGKLKTFLKRWVPMSSRALKGELNNLHMEIAKMQVRTIPQPFLAQFEINIVSHCNLNCKFCTHFSPIAEESYLAPEEFARDMERMSALSGGNILRILLLGGEPLLHPRLKEMLATARRCFPRSKVCIVTNGVLLLKMDEAFWTACRENAVTIRVTKYPVALDFEGMERAAKEHGVSFEYADETGREPRRMRKYPLDGTGQQPLAASFVGCGQANACVTLMDGRLYTCTTVPNFRYFKQKFETPIEVTEEDSIDIYAVDDMREILRFLATPIPFCRYCKVFDLPQAEPWGPSARRAEEWI